MVKPPPVPLVPGAGPGQYWQGQVAGGQGGYTAPPPGHSMLPPGPNPGYPGYPGYHRPLGTTRHDQETCCLGLVIRGWFPMVKWGGSVLKVCLKFSSIFYLLACFGQ